MELTKRFGLTLEERERRLKFLGLTEEDAQKLLGVHKVAEAQVDEIVDRLYEHVLSFERATADLREELARKEKLAILGQWAGGMVHELRNPLAAMQASVYFLKTELEPRENAKTARHLHLIEKELNNANEIITNLLDFSRVKPPNRVRVSIADLVNEVLARYEWRTIQLITNLDDAHALVDSGQAKQIIGNLVANAVQAMEEGGQLTVTSSRDGDFAIVVVEDTGVGIPADVLHKIFQPLFTTKAKGIGLGLSVCESLVRANHGRIRVSSEVGKGTIFTVEFPLEVIDARSMAHPAGG